jgi:hypothetical protein
MALSDEMTYSIIFRQPLKKLPILVIPAEVRKFDCHQRGDHSKIKKSIPSGHAVRKLHIKIP